MVAEGKATTGRDGLVEGQEVMKPAAILEKTSRVSLEIIKSLRFSL